MKKNIGSKLHCVWTDMLMRIVLLWLRLLERKLASPCVRACTYVHVCLEPAAMYIHRFIRLYLHISVNYIY